MADLSLYSNYRYLFLSIMIVVFALLYILSFIFPFINYLKEIFMYPYLKEEVRKCLYVWNDSFMGDLCIYLFNKISENTLFYRVFFTIHFIIFYCLRGLGLCLLLNFAFASGDFRLIIYFCPIYFIIWICSFLDYYCTIFRQGTTNYLKELLLVTPKENSFIKESDYIIISDNNLNYTLSNIAIEEGYTLVHLKNIWLTSANVEFKFTSYKKVVSYFNYIFFAILIICWFTISFLFIQNHIEFYGLLGVISRRPILHLNTSHSLRAPREIRFVKEKYQNLLKIESNGSYSPGHPIIIEVEGQENVRVDAQITSGEGGKEPHQRSTELSKTGVNNSNPVNYVPIRNKENNTLYIPKNHLTKNPMLGSVTYCAKNIIKDKLDATTNKTFIEDNSSNSMP